MPTPGVQTVQTDGEDGKKQDCKAEPSKAVQKSNIDEMEQAHPTIHQWMKEWVSDLGFGQCRLGSGTPSNSGLDLALSSFRFACCVSVCANSVGDWQCSNAAGNDLKCVISTKQKCQSLQPVEDQNVKRTGWHGQLLQ